MSLTYKVEKCPPPVQVIPTKITITGDKMEMACFRESLREVVFRIVDLHCNASTTRDIDTLFNIFQEAAKL